MLMSIAEQKIRVHKKVYHPQCFKKAVAKAIGKRESEVQV
jgi:hypothetical protein